MDGSHCSHKLSKVGPRRDICRYSCTEARYDRDATGPATLTVDLDAACRRNKGAVRHSGRRLALWQQPTWCWSRLTVGLCSCAKYRLCDSRPCDMCCVQWTAFSPAMPAELCHHTALRHLLQESTRRMQTC